MFPYVHECVDDYNVHGVLDNWEIHDGLEAHNGTDDCSIAEPKLFFSAPAPTFKSFGSGYSLYVLVGKIFN
jgi:hypothetical protein